MLEHLGFLMARKIFGRIQVEGGIPPGTKMRVIAWDADVDEDDHMGVIEVMPDGTYSIEYEDVNWDWAPTRKVSSWKPDIYVVVEWLNERTDSWEQVAKSKVYSDQDIREDREINITVNLPHTNSNTIYGWVTDKEGRPMEGYTVTAWDEKPKRTVSVSLRADKDIEEKEPAEYLGSSITDKKGHYRIRYAASRFHMTLDRLMREGIDAYRRPDMFIKIHNRDDSGILFRSPTIQNIIGLTGCRIDAKIDIQ